MQKQFSRKQKTSKRSKKNKTQKKQYGGAGLHAVRQLGRVARPSQDLKKILERAMLIALGKSMFEISKDGISKKAFDEGIQAAMNSLRGEGSGEGTRVQSPASLFTTPIQAIPSYVPTRLETGFPWYNNPNPEATSNESNANPEATSNPVALSRNLSSIS